MIEGWCEYLTEYKNASNYTEVFNRFLKTKLYTYDYNFFNDELCFCEKKDNCYVLYYISKKMKMIQKVEYDLNDKRKMYNFLDNYNFIIYKNFSLNKDAFDHKICLRYEVIVNLLSSNKTHFFKDDFLYHDKNIILFFTEKFITVLEENPERYELIKFASFLLNTFEEGFVIDDIVLKPTITISPYGRWYWSGTEKIQNDKKARNKIYNKLLKYGKILNIDLVSGEPSILAELANSKLIKHLINYRIKLKDEDKELRDMIKNLLNIFIHSIDTPEDACKKFKYHNNYELLENKFGPILSLFEALQKDLLWYNKKIIETYEKDLAVDELFRRIVMPHTSILKPREIIKEHRKFLQGHTHDRILNLARINYENLQLLPIFTIHDSLSYFVNHLNYEKIAKKIYKIAKKLNYKITIEVLE